VKRLPFATLLGVLCFAVLSIFTQQRAAADRDQTPTTRSNKTVVNANGTVTTVSDETEGEFVPGEMLVKFRNEKDAVDATRGPKNPRGHLKTANPRLNEIFARFAVNNGTRPFARAKALAKVVKLTTQTGNLKEALAALREQPEVEYAELNMIVHTQTAPNDPYYSTSGAWGQQYRDLWGLQSISAEAAWDTSQGDGVLVAVVDSGLDYNHEDIAGNVWLNDGEVGLDGNGNDKRSNGIDDDGNGLIDDWHGWDFVTLDGTPGDNDPMDNHGHGTHVSGTIAAMGNNGLGVIGVAPHAKIMAVKGLDSTGSGSIEDLSNAIIYAADKGASVINLSWGGSGPTPQTLIDAISYAHNVKGAVVVAAAGNSNFDVGTQINGFYPACIRDVITVSAVNHLDAKASFSNFGAKIDVTAPGGGDTDPTGLLIQPDRSILSLKSSLAGSIMTGSGQLIVGTKYLRQSGTSMASPHVAGVAALIRAQHPEFSPEQVRQVLRSSADDIGATGFDTQFGYGRLNASRSLTIAAPLAATLTGPVGTLSGLSQVDVTGSVGGANLSSWRLEYGAGTAPSSWTVITTSSNTINAGTLATWNLSGINDGTYTLHLVAQALTGEIYQDRLTVVLDGLVITDPSPLSISITRGEGGITIRGTVASANFARYTIAILALRNNTFVSNSAITVTNGGLQPVHDGVLGTWDTTGAAPDTYRISVTQIFTNNTSVVKSTKVALDSSLHPGWPIDIGLLSNGIASLAVINHVNAADVDGNGTKEIILGYNNKVSVVDHTGAQLPGWPQTIDPTNSGAHIQISPAVADLDGDGSPEILAANDQNKMFIWSANGTLRSGWPKNIAGFMTNIAVDDLTGDGQKEIIISVFGSVRVFNTNGVMLPGWPFFTNVTMLPPAIGDVDGDGQKEIVVATNSGPTNLYMIKANGVVMPGWPKAINPQLPSNFTASSYPVLGDLDGDGTMECVIGSANGFVHAFRANGSNVPGWPQATKATAVNPPAIGDIDGDGLPEVVAGNDRIIENNSSANYLFAWHANGTILPNWPVKYDRQITHSSFGYGAPALADLDQDGRADIIVSSDTTNDSHSALNAYKSDGSKVPGFPKPTLDTGASPANTVAVADLDGDGSMEMAWIDVAARLYVWDLSAPSTAVAPWPMFQHDEQHTGASLRTPETLPPTATITSPAAGSLLAGTVNITVEASDNVGVVNVEVYKDNFFFLSTNQSTFTFEWNTGVESDGPHTFVLKAYDAAGNVGTSTFVFDVDNIPPIVDITAPGNGAILSGSAVTISANASDNVGLQKVEFYYDFNLINLIGTDTSAPFTVNWDISQVPSGEHTLIAIATDTAGNRRPSSEITVTLDNVPPAVAFSNPSNGAAVTGIVNLAVNATDAVGVQKVQYYRDSSVLLGTSLSAPFDLSWDSTTASEGSHTLFAVATDLAGNTATSATISVSVDRSLPAVSLTAPSSNAIVSGSAVALSATASDNIGVSRVDFYRDGNVLLGTDNSSPYGISWDSTSTTSGAHTLFAVAIDLAGNTKTSTVVNVSVDNTAPQVSLTAPANGAFVTGTLAVSATATDNVGISKVEFYSDNVLLTTDTNSPYTFNWNSTTVTDGAHTLYAIAQDTSGLRTTSAGVAVTVDNTAPTVAITSPANGATVQRNTIVNINANASDNVGVVKVEFYVGNTLTCTDTAAPYTCAWQVPNPKANFTLKATAYDAVGKTATHTISVSTK